MGADQTAEARREDGPIIQRPWLRWSVLFGSFTLVGLFFSGQNVVGYVTRGRPIDWERAIFGEMVYWYIWVAITPFILWYARHYRIERASWLQGVGAHLGMSLIVAPLQEALWMLFLLLGLNAMSWSQVGEAWPDVRASLLVGSLTSFYKYWLIIGIYYTFDYYRKYRDREREAAQLKVKAAQLEAQLTQSELDALKMQLHPHFLFNTLNTISVFMKEDVEKANRMLVRLSELLRTSLEQAGGHVVPLRQELAFLRRYLEIEQIRFEDRLQIRTEIEPDVLDAEVPNLILQPLVENAIRHGIAPHASAGRIEIRGRRNNDELVLEVYDDGPGFEGSRQADHRGIGLSNVQARLQQLYGSDHRLNVRAAEEGGTLAVIVIPYRLSTEAREQPLAQA